MRTWPVLFSLFFFTNTIAQHSIKGTVVNILNDAPIPGSSVFIAGTSRGTTTTADGSFELADVPAGKHELVISCIGYATVVHSFSDEQLPLRLKVQMEIKAKELENVLLEPSVEEGWDKWGRTFMENFVGSTENALHCRIKNQESIRFRFYKKSNRLIAYCDEPVLLENKALGYLVSYQLENFEVNFREHSLSYMGYPLYQPLENGRQQKWDRKRADAYSGSVLHFMRSLYANRLAEEGFEVRRMVRAPNYEKERVRKIYRPTFIKKTVMGGMSIQLGNSKDTVAVKGGDSTAYYQRVMEQGDFIDTYGRSLLAADSLIVETAITYKVLHFDDYIYITYKNELEEKGYVANKFPLRNPTYQRSYVTLLNDKLIVLDATGNYYNPQDFNTSAYWGWGEKMANSVPLDYQAGKTESPEVRKTERP